jgi:hypothetical protein
MKEIGKCKCSPRCMGAKVLILGVLILLNAIYGWLSWGVFVGGIIAIIGLVHLIFGCCPACKCK